MYRTVHSSIRSDSISRANQCQLKEHQVRFVKWFCNFRTLTIWTAIQLREVEEEVCSLCGRQWIFKCDVIHMSRNRLIKWYWHQQTAQSIIHNVIYDPPTCFDLYKVIITEVYTKAHKKSTMVKTPTRYHRGIPFDEDNKTDIHICWQWKIKYCLELWNTVIRFIF
jgi:hypothetical protein